MLFRGALLLVVAVAQALLEPYAAFHICLRTSCTMLHALNGRIEERDGNAFEVAWVNESIERHCGHNLRCARLLLTEAAVKRVLFEVVNA